jgi:hypothetical protein
MKHKIRYTIETTVCPVFAKARCLDLDKLRQAKLSRAGTRYSTFDKELLAAFSAVRHFRFLLEGRRFRLLTDHKPLVTSLFCTTPPWSASQQ